MCNPPDHQRPEAAPLGHSRAAHRVHGWCADCTGRTVGEELVAWRVEENRREEATQATRDASSRSPSAVNLHATTERPCPACGREAMTLVSVVMTLAGGERRTVGGWAHCALCDATPHPTMPDVEEDADRG